MQSWLKGAAKSSWSLAAKVFKTPETPENKKGEKKQIRMTYANIQFVTSQQNLPI